VGIIIKQSIRGTIYSYVGVILGTINVLVLMPTLLLAEEIGLINLLVALSNIFAEFSALGFNQVTTRLFSYFRDKQNKNNGYLYVVLLVTCIGFILSVIAFFFVKPALISSGGGNTSLFANYIFLLIPLIGGTLFYNVFDNLLKVLYSSTVGTFYKEVIFRVLVFINLLMVYLDLYKFHVFLVIYIITLLLPTVFLFINIARKGELSFKRSKGFIGSGLRKQMIKVASFGMMSSVASMAITNIDKYLVTAYLDLKSTGIYSIAFFMGSLILKPSAALSKISSVILADSWKNNDLKTIFTIYRKGCAHMYLIGVYILLGIWINIGNIFHLLPSEYAKGEMVVLIIGLAFLVEMISGASGMIMATSRDFPLLTYFRISSGVVLVTAGYFLIPEYGINGAAFSVLCSHLTLSISKIVFMYIKFKIHPFDRNMLFISLIAILSYGLIMFLPELQNVFVDIVVRSGLFTLLFLFLTLKFKVSQSVRDIFQSVINKVKNLR